MKLFIHTQKLLAAVSLVSHVVGKKESLPVLSCILLEGKGGEVVLRATNLESGVEVRVPARVTGAGICAVPATILTHTLRSVRAAEITLEYDDKNISLHADGSITQIHTVPHEEFPTLPIPPAGAQFSISIPALCSGIRSVAYAAATSTIRPEFASIFISHKDNALWYAATDSFRLAEKKVPLQTNKNIPDILIPTKNALDIIHLFEKNTDTDAVCIVADHQLNIRAGGVSFISRVVDAPFPNYTAIIPKKADTEAVILKEDLLNMLQKARVFSGTTQHISLHLYPSKKIFSVSAQHADIGSMADSVDAAISGDAIDIKFNIPLIQDCLQAIASDSIILRFAGEGKPMIIRGVSDDTFLYLVMPLNR
jgi:DNA polymerase III subunit beta